MADPLYRLIAEDLRQQISSGRLKPGSPLPPEEKLKDKFAASRNTIRDAVKLLISLGLVETRPGQGTFVIDPPDPLVTTLTANRVTGMGGGEGVAYLSEAKERNPRASRPCVESQMASAEIAARLGVDQGTALISRHQRRFISRQEQPVTGSARNEERQSGRTSPAAAEEAPEFPEDLAPWSLQTSYYRWSLARDGADRLLAAEDITEGTVRYLEESLQIKQAGYRDWITVRAPDPNEVTFFRLPSDGRIPVFEIFRTAFDQTGKPMRVTVTIFPADRNQFIIDVGDVPARPYEPPSK